MKYTDVKDQLFLNESNAIKKIIEDIPIVNKNEFIELTQPADIIITQIPPSVYTKKSIIVKMISNLSKTVQGIPYTSMKLIVDNKTIIGYGIPRKNLPKNNFTTYSLPVYTNLLSNACLIRHKDITSNKSKEVINYAIKRKNIDYAFDHVYKTFWNRFFGEKYLQFFNRQEPFTKEEAREYSEPLLCSSIIALSFIANNLSINTDVKNVLNIWPKDFLLSDSFELIAKLNS